MTNEPKSPAPVERADVEYDEQTETAKRPAAPRPDARDDRREAPRATRELPSVAAAETRELPRADLLGDEGDKGNEAADAAGPGAFDGLDPDATIIREAPRPPDLPDAPPLVAPPPVAPRKPTLSAALNRSTNRSPSRPEASQPAPAPQPAHAETREARIEPAPPGVADEVDEWSIEDQPTVYAAPRDARSPLAAAARAQSAMQAKDAGATRTPPPPASRPPQPRAAPPSASPVEGPRLASPTGRLMPSTPPTGVPRAAAPNPRMERFQTLRRRRLAHEEGGPAQSDARPVADLMRQWWNDLLPGLQQALNHQHEAKASGAHPIPAYESSTTAKMGDAFGRLAASARTLTERAQALAGPTFKRLHEQAEQAADRLVERIEGPQAQQQAPFLGPGRIAIFFKPGVSVGQAQRLLAASRARPIRLIPRKHGFLAFVQPGLEAEISERLRQHPYVRDVAYLEYDEYGDPLQQW